MQGRWQAAVSLPGLEHRPDLIDMTTGN